MSRLSHTATGTVLLATFVLSACGGGDTSTASPTPSTPALVALEEKNQYAAAAVALLTPIEVLSVSGDFVGLPQSQSVASEKARQAMSKTRAAKQAKMASATSTEIVREVEACEAGGEVVIETEDSVVTAWSNACRETAKMDGMAIHTEENGWVRYTLLPNTKFEEAYTIEEDTVFKVKGGVSSGTDYAEHLQTRMHYFQQGERLRLEDVDYTLTDKGTYLGQSYSYTQAAQKLAYTSDPKAGVMFSGRVGGWGTYYNGDTMMNGLLEVASVVPLFFDRDGIPNAGRVAVKGSNSTHALVDIRSRGYKVQLNGKPTLDNTW